MGQAWPWAIVFSLGFHGLVLTAAALHWRARDYPQQTPSEAQINISDQQVAASAAEPAKLLAEPASAASPRGPLVGEGAIPRSSAIAAVPQSTVARPVASTPVTLPVPLAAEVAGALPSAGTKLASAPPKVAAAVQTTTLGQPASAVSLPSEHGTASLAWTGLAASLDPVSLSAIQVFMQPGDPTALKASKGGLRDGIAETLSAVPCARLQTSFDPTTGRMELRGHLPEDSLRAEVLKSLQAQVGSGIPVTDRMQLLPRPQCQLLGGISNVGLAQSTEQETNPRVVGLDTFVQQYSLSAGEQLVFEMTAPDYPSVIYVDYFDAEGSVLHMQPNSQVPAVLSPANSTLAVGQEAPDKPALRLIVGPPFGQEIAVAFAASVPLYAGVRPTVEPAEKYLEFLQQAVRKARKGNPDFKGEWVYFFVVTKPR